MENFEAVEVFWSWQDEQGRAERTRTEFDRLWDDATTGVQVVEFTAATAELLQPYRKAEPPQDFRGVRESGPVWEAKRQKQPTGLPELPEGIRLRDYQEQAIVNWFQNNGTGTLKMATGSGKTITALAIASKLAGFRKIKHLVIICPYRHLVVQWEKECRRFGLDPILAFESRQSWIEALGTRLYNVGSGRQPFLCVITTNTTFALPPFQRQMADLPDASLIIADEAHNLGAVGVRQKLPKQMRFRLALSATPERWFDDEGSAALFKYFGATLEPEFTLADAIRHGALVPYRYYPVFVDLTIEELEEYRSISERIARLWRGDKTLDESPQLKALLIRRARLISTAHNKKEALNTLMKARRDDSHMLVYCGDGSVETDDGEMQRHVESVSRLLGHEQGIRVASYVADTPLTDRRDLLDRLDSGDLQALVAIRCLDEGVDVPSIHTAFILASSTNPRQFIQRRGRVLRPAPGKEVAAVYDMIVVSPADTPPLDSERALVRRELGRYVEFADLALNAGQARAAIIPIQEQFELHGL